MPTDAKGKFHPNHQLAHNADRMASASKPGPSMPEGMGHEPERESVSHTTLHDHGDGTFHTEGEDGSKMEHPHIGHALMSMAAKHSEGSHMHVHGAPMEEGQTTHHVGEDGNVEGPHNHENIEALKAHLGQFFNEEEHEGGAGGHEGYGEHEGLGL